ncbi:hypothetical protein OHR68_04035 [Spirillospora sp. NBC_00431]
MRIRFPARPAGIVLVAVAALALAASVVVLGWRPSPTAAASTGGKGEAAAPREGGESTVEDGAYPGAAKIQEERGITLISGNGLITLAECGVPGLIQVRSATVGLICFKARTWAGAVALIVVKIPDVYTIKGDDHEVEARLSTEKGEIKTYDIVKNQWTPVGEGTSPDVPPETLVELRAAA